MGGADGTGQLKNVKERRALLKSGQRTACACNRHKVRMNNKNGNVRRLTHKHKHAECGRYLPVRFVLAMPRLVPAAAASWAHELFKPIVVHDAPPQRANVN